MPVQPTMFQKELVLFYATWCGHCRPLVGGPDKPWDILETTYVDNPSIKIRKINAEQIEQMPLHERIRYRQDRHTEFRIDGYPTILLIDETGVHNYIGSRSLKSLQLFLNARNYYEKLMKLKQLVESGNRELSNWSLDMRCASRELYSQFDL